MHYCPLVVNLNNKGKTIYLSTYYSINSKINRVTVIEVLALIIIIMY